MASPVIEALTALYNSSSSAQQRENAGSFLEEFQKSSEAWEEAFKLLSDLNQPLEIRVFAAQTLRSKIVYDLYQLPENAQYGLKDSLLKFLIEQRNGSRIIITQICLCLASLAFQLPGWDQVIESIAVPLQQSTPNKALDSSGAVVLLEFIKVIPEEFSDTRKSFLSAEEASLRAQTILQSNSEHVLQLLSELVTENILNKSNQGLIFACLNAWMAEIPMSDLIKSPLVDLTFKALSIDESFEAAVECICTMIKETNDVFETRDIISILYPKVMSLQPCISSSKDDPEQFKGYTRIFSEAGEAWHMLIAKYSTQFKALVEAIAQCTELDQNLDALKYTFNFWDSLKYTLTMRQYEKACHDLSGIYLNLVDVIIKHLRYPIPENEDLNDSNFDLFDGDREEEEKFRSFRHEMGDVLKDCCAVVGPTKCLNRAYNKIKACYNSNACGENVHWQDLEAPLFSLRAMGSEVPAYEDEIMPEIMDTIKSLPEHPKIRYAATLVIGRYSEWTNVHTKYLEPQLNYVNAIFTLKESGINWSPDQVDAVVSAAAQTFMHLCEDCSQHMVQFVIQLNTFYKKVSLELKDESLDEITEGVAYVIAAQNTPEEIAGALKAFVEPVTEKIINMSNTINKNEPTQVTMLGDQIRLLSIFAQIVRPYIEYSGTKHDIALALENNGSILQNITHPCMQIWINVWPILTGVLTKYSDSVTIAERVTQFMKNMIYSYQLHVAPFLYDFINVLQQGFAATKFGCYLWLSGIVIRDYTPENHFQLNGSPTLEAEPYWKFANTQIVTFYQYLSGSSAKDISDAVEDFFRFLQDVLMHLPFIFIVSNLFGPSLQASIASLSSIQATDPLFSILHYLEELIPYCMNRPTSAFPSIPDLVVKSGSEKLSEFAPNLLMTVIGGLVYSFPKEVTQDASSVIIELIQLGNLLSNTTTNNVSSINQASSFISGKGTLYHKNIAIEWLKQTINGFPQGSISEAQKGNLLTNVEGAIISGNWKRVSLFNSRFSLNGIQEKMLHCVS